MISFYFASLLLGVLSCVSGDVYLHNPRGSNNRLNEKSANRNNANRAFDSQNNNRGGYNVGDSTDKKSNSEAEQFNMWYFAGSAGKGKSYLTLEWTNQHGCGGNEDTDQHKMNCQIILQYMCQEYTKSIQQDTLRNGANTNTQNFNKNNKKSTETKAQAQTRKNSAVKTDRVLQESWEWYDKCTQRERNKGLFTADQKLAGVTSQYTRQNPNGNRRGYECPEERDYYPYWHPTEWKDIAILTQNTSMCNWYKKESFNTKPKGECVEYYSDKTRKHWSMYNNKESCEKDPARKWKYFTNFLERAPQYKTQKDCERAKTPGAQYVWGVRLGQDKEECLVALSQPECIEASWSRDNHLGNGREGVPLNYTWSLPYFPSEKDQTCVVRIRYNISTDDYDPWKTDVSSNKDIMKGIFSPIEQNPIVNIGANNVPLRLALNTAQYGRTFQDRSHKFILKTRTSALADKAIYNLNVRGKRGNIVQVYPAVEYDFIPNKLQIKEEDVVHIQWTGSNTHNNGQPAGDGQAGDAGEGTTGTDRNNMVEISNLLNNYPVPFERSKLFAGAEVLWKDTDHQNGLDGKDIAASMASSGYFKCMYASKCAGNSVQNKQALQNQLNNAPASYRGMVLKFKKGTYYYMCSRNNNFTNRSQKGTLVVS